MWAESFNHIILVNRNQASQWSKLLLVKLLTIQWNYSSKLCGKKFLKILTFLSPGQGKYLVTFFWKFNKPKPILVKKVGYPLKIAKFF